MDKRQNALMALLVLSLDRICIAIININRHLFSQSDRLLSFNILTIIFLWVLPLLIVYKIEHRGFESYGMRVPESKYVPYFSFGLLGIFVPGLFLGFQNLFLELFEQILFIGFVEEVFYRGYLMKRFCEWKGDKWGLGLSSIFFSLAHVVFILSNEGFRYPGFIGMTMLQTFIGGFFLGYIFLGEGNIIPGAIIHISTNIYMSRIFG